MLTTRVTVADNIQGLNTGADDCLFERFYRQDSVRDRSGTGLGLSIVEWIVKVHYGKLLVESKPDEGTAFTVLFSAA